MKKLKKIILIFLLVIFLLISTFIGLMFRPNLSLEQLEDTYFTEYSHYLDVVIQDLEGSDLSIRIHYQDLGDKEDPVIVLVHGAFSSSHTFLPWAETLVEAGYRVILPDLPYFGLSGGFDDNITSYRRSAETIYFLLDSLSVDKIDIGGNSVGGAVSWFLTSEYPEMVKSLTLIDAVYPYMEQEGRDQLGQLAESEFFANTVSQMTPKFLVGALLKTAYGDPDKLTDEILTRYYEILRKDGTRKAIIQVKQESEPDFTYQARLESIDVPILIQWGALDTWILPETIDNFQTSCNVLEDNIIIYDDLGHVPMEEDPESTVSDFLDFLNRIT